MIGVVTPYKVINYGTKLQAYAMQKLFEKYDDAEIINFLTKSDSRPSALRGKIFSLDIWNHKIIEKIKEHQQRKNMELYENLQIRKKAINSFDKEFLTFSEYTVGSKKLKELVKKYNCVVCGSDQLWAPRNVIADYFTLTWVPRSCTIMSFSASFGISEVPIHLRRKYKCFLRRFDFIAVRENNGRDIVKNMIGRDAVVTADPTIMLERDEWENVSKRSKISIGEPYIFCYFLGSNGKHRNFADELKKITGLKVVNLPHFIEYCDADEKLGDYKLYDVSPSDFLYLIANAEIVLTDSFHASVFSFIFEKKLGLFERFRNDSMESTNSRIYSLLNNLNAEYCLIKDNISISEFLSKKMDYATINDRLDKIRKKSNIYISSSFDRRKHLVERND